MAAPLVEAAGLKPGNVYIVLINDPSINAFVAGGQAVYIHSGLINAADTANEVQGVIAHELGHITGGHIVRFDEGVSQATNISILSLILGVGAALAGGGEAAMGVIAAEIGRASCRERVCQYVWISVGAGELKKKKE